MCRISNSGNVSRNDGGKMSAMDNLVHTVVQSHEFMEAIFGPDSDLPDPLDLASLNIAVALELLMENPAKYRELSLRALDKAEVIDEER